MKYFYMKRGTIKTINNKLLMTVSQAYPPASVYSVEAVKVEVQIYAY